MATSKEYLQYVCEQLSGMGDISARPMMGEYIVYYREKYVAAICGNQFFLKPTEAARELLQTPCEQPPYEGAKPYFLIEDLEDTAHLQHLVRATYDALPPPKPKKMKRRKAE